MLNTFNHVGDHVHVGVRDFLVDEGVLVIWDQLVTNVYRFHRRVGAEVATAQEAGEGLPELGVEGVDDGVEGGVGPAEPHEDVESRLADARQPRVPVCGWPVAERDHAVQDEER